MLHGFLCTTHFSGPLVIINGPAAKSIGMNSGVNALGQGNRANATIGRALHLIVQQCRRRPAGAIDRATLGIPASTPSASPRTNPTPTGSRCRCAAALPPAIAVTLFHGEGVKLYRPESRTPEELVRSLAMGLFGVGHPKLCLAGNAVLVLSPEHYKIFKDGGWGRRQIEDALYQALKRPGHDLMQGAQGVAEGLPASGTADKMIDKFQPDGLLIVRAGGEAGLFSAIIGGWPGQSVRDECQAVTKEICSMNPSTKLRDPTAESSPTRRARLAPPSSIDGKTVALMDIGKSRGAEFIDRLERHFKKAGVATKRYRKPTNTKVAPLALMQQIAAEAQLAVIAFKRLRLLHIVQSARPQ